MDLYANVLLITLAGIYVLFFIELGYAKIKGDFEFRSLDVISSLSAGMTNAIKAVLGLTVVIFGYDYMFTHFAIVESNVTWVTYVIALLALDFATYWYHRLAHHVNLFWNRHVIHHSGEDFNIATALRQSISKFVNISVFFLLPAALLGVPPKIIVMVAPFHLFVQVWYHTTHIGKLGWLEYFIVTPSQHRVHHAINDIYMDRNFSPVFCIWDRMFGTFQEELDSVPVVYGVKRQVHTWNPILINVDHLWLMIKDAWRAKKFVDKLKIWFMPTGWRPADVEVLYPVPVASAEAFVKYDTKVSLSLQLWSWFQFVMLSLMVIHLLMRIMEIGTPDIFFYGGFMFLMVYSYTTLMDKSESALWIELGKSILGLAIIYFSGDWFGLSEWIPGGLILVVSYFLIHVQYSSRNTLE